MLTHVAADKMAADRSGNQYEVHDAISLSSEGLSGHDSGTDLGGIDHLFRDPFHSALNLVNQGLQVPTQATRGPNGGKIPSYLTHTATVLKADGQQLWDETNIGHGTVIGAKAANVLEPFRTILYRARVLLNRIGGGGG